MKSRICALLLECLRLKTTSKENQAQKSAQAGADAKEYSTLKRLNDLRLKQLSTGWGEQSGPGSGEQTDQAKGNSVTAELPLPVVADSKGTALVTAAQTTLPQPVAHATLPAVPSDSFNRLEAFIAAKHLESQTQANPYELDT